MSDVKRNILIVDDDPDMCWALRCVVESQGYHCKVVMCGADAIDAMILGDFELVFLDAKLPDIDGLDILNHLRSNGYLYPPVILVTGYHYHDDPSVRNALMRSMINGFIAKPFDHAAIISEIVRHGADPLNHLGLRGKVFFE